MQIKKLTLNLFNTYVEISNLVMSEWHRKINFIIQNLFLRILRQLMSKNAVSI